MAPRVLLIDDDSYVLQMMEAAFDRAGFETWSARNGCVGVELFHAQRPDLVVTDIIMSEMDGLETIIALKRLAVPPKVIAISDGGRLGGGDFLTWARRLGADEVLAKPFRMSALIGAATGLLEQTSAEDQVHGLEAAAFARRPSQQIAGRELAG